MKPLVSATFLIAATLVSGAAAVRADEIRACDFKLKSGCIGGDAKVTLDAARSDGGSKWSEDGGATVITSSSDTPTQRDSIKVTVGRFVSIDFSHAQSGGRCGAGAELPRALVIPEKKGRTCRVFLSPDEQ